MEYFILSSPKFRPYFPFNVIMRDILESNFLEKEKWNFQRIINIYKIKFKKAYTIFPSLIFLIPLIKYKKKELKFHIPPEKFNIKLGEIRNRASRAQRRKRRWIKGKTSRNGRKIFRGGKESRPSSSSSITPSAKRERNEIAFRRSLEKSSSSFPRNRHRKRRPLLSYGNKRTPFPFQET